MARTRLQFRATVAGVLALAAVLLSAGCEGGPRGNAGVTGTPGTTGTTGEAAAPITLLGASQDLPGVVLDITSVAGATRSDGTFQAGDTIAVTFTVKKNNGVALPLSSLDLIALWAAGPSFNYQHLIPTAHRTASLDLKPTGPKSFQITSDVKARAVLNTDGSYTYAFATAIPATYPTPLNDTTKFTDGELTGQALLAGTYTVAMRAYKTYTVGSTSVNDVGNATKDFLFGGAATLEPREVVKTDNCNRCHVTISSNHGKGYRDTRVCVTCHGAGSEDRSSTDTGDATPITIEFKSVIHKVHNAKHLPSVNGVGVNADGTRNYAATATPFQGTGGDLHDFSEVAFPVMPSAYAAFLYDATGTTYQGAVGNGPMPKDTGFSALSAAQKLQEDTIRTGVVACDTCHGDPDGDGALTAPTQGTLAYTQPSRRACGSCHDDVDFTKPYTSNGQTMPAQLNDSGCPGCHVNSGNNLDTILAHRHPYSDPALNTGVNVSVTAVAGGTAVGGQHQAGDPIQVTFNVTNDAGTNIQIHQLHRLQMIVVGPTSNTQLIVPNVNPYDVTDSATATATLFRKSSPFTGNGTISMPTVGGTAVAQVLCIAFTGDNTFDVIGSVSGTLAAGLVVPDSGADTGDLTYAGVTFKITDGSTNFAAGDRWYFEAVPTADSYTNYVPFDISFERVGVATGGVDVLTVANLPLYWGRQTVYESTAPGVAVVTSAAATAEGRYVVASEADLTLNGIAVGDKVVLDFGGATEEYLTVGRIQTTDDTTGADLGTNDRLWFKTALRYDHLAGANIQEVSLGSSQAKREGIAYTVTDAANGVITLVAGQFTAGRTVVVSYRTRARFGWKRAPGDADQTTYPASLFDSGDFDVTWGSWKGMAYADGTYTVGFWANQDFTVTPAGVVTTREGWNNYTSDNTTYRMISPPATKLFLYGAATTLTARSIISSGDNCNTCHGDLTSHGFGRRGLDTCLLCHSQSGAEDKALYGLSTAWQTGGYITATPGVTLDFRTLMHKVHMGEDLANASTYVVNGDFRGSPYPTRVADIRFPAVPGNAKHCEKCHGTGSTAWKSPADRTHPSQSTATPTRVWRAACGSCHDSDAIGAHIDAMTPASGVESCATCHGDNADFGVAKMHKNR